MYNRFMHSILFAKLMQWIGGLGNRKENVCKQSLIKEFIFSNCLFRHWILSNIVKVKYAFVSEMDTRIGIQASITSIFNYHTSKVSFTSQVLQWGKKSKDINCKSKRYMSTLDKIVLAQLH